MADTTTVVLAATENCHAASSAALCLRACGISAAYISIGNGQFLVVSGPRYGLDGDIKKRIMQHSIYWDEGDRGMIRQILRNRDMRPMMQLELEQ